MVEPVASNVLHFSTVHVVQCPHGDLDHISGLCVVPVDSAVCGLAVEKICLHHEENVPLVNHDQYGDDGLLRGGMKYSIVIHDAFGPYEGSHLRVGKDKTDIWVVEGVLFLVVFGIEGSNVLEKLPER